MKSQHEDKATLPVIFFFFTSLLLWVASDDASEFHEHQNLLYKEGAVRDLSFNKDMHEPKRPHSTRFAIPQWEQARGK